MRHLGRLSGVLIAIALVAGCGSAATELPPTHPQVEDTTTTTPAPPIVDSHTGEPIREPFTQPWDNALKAEVASVAHAAMVAFAQPNADQDDWWADFEPYLDQQLAEQMAIVPTENIPVRKVTGPARILDTPGTGLAIVEVPTNVGIFEVTVARSFVDDPWQVTYLGFPEGVH